MRTIDHTLDYLRESLSNYIENDLCKQIYEKIENGDFSREGEFVDELSDKEIEFLDAMLEQEINYAKNVQNDIRVKELNEVYELLF